MMNEKNENPLILQEVNGNVGWIIFNRPEKRNALNFQMWKNLSEVLSEYEKNPQVRVVVICGSGDDAFVSGADISEFKENRSNPETAKVYNQATEEAFYAIRKILKPVVAMIRGFCFGGGCAIALNCDLRIASRDAVFCLPPAKLGIGYGYANVQQVVKAVGMSFAKEMLYTAKRYSGAEALRMGLVHQCVPNEELLKFTKEYVAQLANNAPLTLRSLKLAVEEFGKNPDQRDVEAIEQAMEHCYSSEDYQEGCLAFLEKRKPIFRGK